MTLAGPSPRPHRVAVLALDGLLPFELGIPQRIFRRARDSEGRPLYEVLTCAVREPGPVATDADYAVVVPHGPEALATADTVIVPSSYALGPVYEEGRLTPELAAALAHIRPGTRLVAICTGGYVLAAAGYLDGRPATTHWASAENFQRLFPRVRVDADVLFVDDGDVLTSAGVAAGIDLCLHLLRRDHGTAVANDVARHTVVPPYRDGGQAQYIERPLPRAAAGGHGGGAGMGAGPAARADPVAGHGRAGVDVRTDLHPAVPRGGRGEPGTVADAAAGRAGRAISWNPAICPSTRSPGTPASARPSRCASTCRRRWG